MNIEIKHIGATHSLYPEVCRLREEVLLLPIGLSISALRDTLFRTDHLDDIFAAVDEHGSVTGCLMMTVKDEQTVQLRQMAVAASLQGKGIGALLVKAAEKAMWDKGFDTIMLHARMPARDFYEKLGYTVCSDVFEEVNIPHVVMQKSRP